MSKDGRMIISAANYLRIADYLVTVTLKYAQARDALHALRRVAAQLHQHEILCDGELHWCDLCDSPIVNISTPVVHAEGCLLMQMETILADAGKQQGGEAVDDQALVDGENSPKAGDENTWNGIV